MNYFYDVFLNFNEDNLMFYEWDRFDDIEYFKKVPLFLVSSKTLSDFLNYDVMLSKEFLDNLNGKNVAIFADKNGCIAIEFSDIGKSIARSFLKLEDELNLLEMLFTLRTTKINYQTLKKQKKDSNLRIDNNIKLFINTEIKTLVEKKDINKLKYIYMEWFSRIPKKDEEMLKDINTQLNKEIGLKELRIYDLIKLSYPHV